MKKGACLINASRGTVVDIPALAQALRSDHLSGAAIDVYPEEPETNSDGFVTELQGLPNVVLTPHIGGSTEEAQQDIGHFVAGKLRDYVGDGTTTLSVNLPPVALPREAGSSRLLHIHRNTPGVLATVDGVLAGHGINIEGQLLATRGEYGYVVTDIGVPDPGEVPLAVSPHALTRFGSTIVPGR